MMMETSKTTSEHQDAKANVISGHGMTSERESAGMHVADAPLRCGELSNSVQQSTAADAVQQRRQAFHDRQAHTLR